jgi:hypothetical protein
MNWRRGLLLAGIHLAVAGTLMVWLEVETAQHRKSHVSDSTKTVQMEATQEGGTVSFSPCGMWVHYPPQTYIVQLANLPSAALIEWPSICPDRGYLAGLLHLSMWPPSISVEQRFDFSFALLILLQWFLVGGFPLIRPRRWWGEPGAFIMLCTLTAFVIVLIPGIGALAKLPMLFALFAWFWWFGLLVWMTLRSGWRLLARRTALSR